MINLLVLNYEPWELPYNKVLFDYTIFIFLLIIEINLIYIWALKEIPSFQIQLTSQNSKRTSLWDSQNSEGEASHKWITHYLHLIRVRCQSTKWDKCLPCIQVRRNKTSNMECCLWFIRWIRISYHRRFCSYYQRRNIT